MRGPPEVDRVAGKGGKRLYLTGRSRLPDRRGNFLKEEMVMAISPMDIHLKEFSTVATGGYNKEEVDSFLDTVADELEKLSKRNQELEEAVSSMRQKVSRFEEMQKTLETALASAQKSAGNILQEARSQAAAIIKKAQERSDRILEEMERERQRVISSISALRQQIIDQIPSMRELLNKSQGLLNEFEAHTRKVEIQVQAVPEEKPAVEEKAAETPAGEPAVAETAGAASGSAEESAEEEKEKYVWD